jgi:protein-S-isoprenylcysteine O-methyltransferase Ste14
MTPSPPDPATTSQPDPNSTSSRAFNDPWLREIVSRVPLIVLHVWLAGRVVREWLLTGRITGFLLVGNATLIIYLTLRRRQANRVDRNPLAWTAALAGTLGPLALNPSGQGPIPDAYTAWLTLAGFGVSTAGLVALGRSFGIVAAHRGIVQHGIYRVIRHPAYAGYFLTHIGFVLAYPTTWNFVMWLVADSLQLVRIMFEERMLRQNDEYRAYIARVRWRMLPGIF